MFGQRHDHTQTLAWEVLVHMGATQRPLNVVCVTQYDSNGDAGDWNAPRTQFHLPITGVATFTSRGYSNYVSFSGQEYYLASITRGLGGCLCLVIDNMDEKPFDKWSLYTDFPFVGSEMTPEQIQKSAISSIKNRQK